MALERLAPAHAPLAEATHPSTLVRAAEWLTAYGPALIVLTLPLEFTARYMGQPLVRYVIVLVGLAFAYLLVTGRRRLAIPRQWSARWLAAFVAVSIVSWLVTHAPSSYKAFTDLALYPVFAIMVTNLVFDERDQSRAWVAFLVSGLVVAIAGFGLYLTHHQIWVPNPVVGNRMNITFADPNITARFLTLVAAAAVVLFATRKAPTWLCLAAGVACAAVTPMTYSRSGLALFIVVVVFAAVVTAGRKRSIALAAGLLAVFALSTAVNPVTRIRALDAYDTFASLAGVSGIEIPVPKTQPEVGTGDTVLADNRRYLVVAGLRMFHDHPVLGVGYGGYQHALTTKYSWLIPSNLTTRDVASHTAFVTIASEMGLVGIVLFALFLFTFAWESFRFRRDVWALVPAVIVVPILLYSQFEGRLIEEPYFWLCLALAYAAMRARPAPRIASHTM